MPSKKLESDFGPGITLCNYFLTHTLEIRCIFTQRVRQATKYLYKYVKIHITGAKPRALIRGKLAFGAHSKQVYYKHECSLFIILRFYYIMILIETFITYTCN